jgi:hypothetical protein
VMKAELEISAPSLFTYYGAVLWPYLMVGVGLYVWHSAWLAIGGYHLGMAIGLGLARWPIRRPNLCWHRPVQLRVGRCSLIIMSNNTCQGLAKPVTMV